MHIGLVAVRGSVSEFIDAFAEVWPKFEIVATKDGFANEDEIWAWKDANERFVSAADWTKADPGQEVYVICQDGQWAVLMDFSYVLATDEKALAQLSERFGSALSFVAQTTSGCAFFWNYESGEMKRSIQSVDGEAELAGEALTQEAGIDIQHYYMNETEQLMQAFGLSKLDQLLVPATAVAIAVADRTDYSDLHVEAKAKPWWKFC
ncbi:MAG: hypothetical protein IPK01_01630 [Acidobacteria bacterium]|nr:hypothetical protein [Acidobacteriota bacterium]